MHCRLIALFALLLACVAALTTAMPAGDDGVLIQPAELVFEEHLPSQDGQQSDKTLAKFVEELLALRNKPL